MVVRHSDYILEAIQRISNGIYLGEEVSNKTTGLTKDQPVRSITSGRVIETRVSALRLVSWCATRRVRFDVNSSACNLRECLPSDRTLI